MPPAIDVSGPGLTSLAEGETRLRSAFDLAAIGKALVARDGAWLRVNPALCQCLGYTESELLRMTFQDITHPDDVDADVALVQEMLDGVRLSYQMEKRYLHKRGGVVWALLSVSAVYDEEGGVRYFISEIQDITALKEGEEIRRERERHLEAVIALQQALAAFQPDQPLDEALALVEAEASRITGADGAVIGFLDGGRIEDFGVRAAAERELGPDFGDEHSLLARCVRTGEVIVCADTAEDGRADAESAPMGGERSAVAVPLTYRGETFGALRVFSSTKTHAFDADDIATLQLIAGQLAAVVSHAHAYEVKREREAYYRLLAENMSDLVCLHAPDGAYEWVSPSVEGMLGYRPEELIGVDPYRLFHPDDAERIQHESHERLIRGEEQASSITYRIRHKDGHWVWLETLTQAILDDEGQVERLQTASRDVSERHEMEERLVRQAHHDALTDLPNRTLFYARLDEAIADAERAGEYAVLFLDLDRFKTINDSLGHTAGDRLLREVAGRLLGEVRPCDTVARFGGDEFAILLRGLPHAAHAEGVAKRVAEALCAPVCLDGRELAACASIGVVTGRADHASADSVLLEADLAMYDAKKAGRGTYAIFSPAARASAARRHQLEMDLRYAADRGELRAAYQPVVRLTDGALIGFEALVRWQHPEFGLLYPDAFIGLAEESGQIARIDRWILAEACRQTTAWREAFEDRPLLLLNVNCSSRDLVEEGYSDHVRRILEDQRLSPDRLLLEITESLLAEDTERAAAELQRLRDRGVRFCIDDFGTGYSSLSTLHTLPIDTIKVDRSFVSAMDADDRSRRLVETVVRLGRILEKSVVAEGIETPAELEALRRMGCAFGQGYLFDRPLAPEAATALVAADVPPWSAYFEAPPASAAQW